MHPEIDSQDPFDTPFIQHLPSAPSLEERRLKKGIFLIRMIIGFAIFINICSMLLTKSFIIQILQIGLHLLLFRGFRWVRIVLALGYLYNVYLFYAVYKILVVHLGFIFGFMVLPFFLCNLLALFLVFLDSSVNYYLETQRELWR